MNSLPQITFPKSEWGNIKTRLDENKVVSTIRVGTEYDKYKEGDILMTEWGSKVKILSVRKLNGGVEELEDEYPYFDQLTPEMIQEIEPYQDIEIISLSINGSTT